MKKDKKLKNEWIGVACKSFDPLYRAKFKGKPRQFVKIDGVSLYSARCQI